MSGCCKERNSTITISVSPTEGTCPIGETVGKRNIAEKKFAVLSCEGACIRGEIARRAANLVARTGDYRRGCHGEFLTVPDSSMAQWISSAEKVVCVDGCFLRCHSRIFENAIGKDRLIVFDAQSRHKRFNDIFDADDVPNEEIQAAAEDVAAWILTGLETGQVNENESPCCGTA